VLTDYPRLGRLEDHSLACQVRCEAPARQCGTVAFGIRLPLAVALGRPIKKIAYELGLSGKTVATYVARIRTGLTGYVEIARNALHHHLVE